MRATRILMGMPITIEVVGAADAAIADRVFDYFESVDRRFSEQINRDRRVEFRLP